MSDNGHVYWLNTIAFYYLYAFHTSGFISDIYTIYLKRAFMSYFLIKDVTMLATSKSKSSSHGSQLQHSSQSFILNFCKILIYVSNFSYWAMELLFRIFKKWKLFYKPTRNIVILPVNYWWLSYIIRQTCTQSSCSMLVLTLVVHPL